MAVVNGTRPSTFMYVQRTPAKIYPSDEFQRIEGGSEEPRKWMH